MAEPIEAIKAQIKEHPWPWLGAVFIIAFILGAVLPV